MKLYTHLNFGGNCEAAAVIHVAMQVADVELIGNDVPPAHFQPVRSSYLYLSVDSPEAADKIYAALAESGQVTMPITETFFATRFAQLRDRFGTLWAILHQRPDA